MIKQTLKHITLLATVLCLFGVSAQGATYGSSNGLLLIPSIDADGNYFARIVLELTEDNRLEVTQFTELNFEENSVLSRIEQSSCISAHPLSRLLAVSAFQSPEQSLCLMKDLGPGIEGGSTISYLLIENEGATLILDNRQAGLSVCCLEIYDGIIDIRAGNYESGIFVEWNPLDSIELSKEYALKIVFSEAAPLLRETLGIGTEDLFYLDSDAYRRYLFELKALPLEDRQVFR